ncbi:hypothetical protein EV424DRAFT_406660 [Suillus variegatus]|nr:hypothetical protein EV424DRAFT_406660 [Suillus variegatus]
MSTASSILLALIISANITRITDTSIVPFSTEIRVIFNEEILFKIAFASFERAGYYSTLTRSLLRLCVMPLTWLSWQTKPDTSYISNTTMSARRTLAPSCNYQYITVLNSSARGLTSGFITKTLNGDNLNYRRSKLDLSKLQLNS